MGEPWIACASLQPFRRLFNQAEIGMLFDVEARLDEAHVCGGIIPFAQGTRARGLHALFLTHGMAEQGDLRSLDQVGSIPSCSSGRRPEQAALSRPSAVRRLRGPPEH